MNKGFNKEIQPSSSQELEQEHTTIVNLVAAITELKPQLEQAGYSGVTIEQGLTAKSLSFVINILSIPHSIDLIILYFSKNDGSTQQIEINGWMDSGNDHLSGPASPAEFKARILNALQLPVKK